MQGVPLPADRLSAELIPVDRKGRAALDRLAQQKQTPAQRVRHLAELADAKARRTLDGADLRTASALWGQYHEMTPTTGERTANVRVVVEESDIGDDRSASAAEQAADPGKPRVH